jgi:hypothetical protein
VTIRVDPPGIVETVLYTCPCEEGPNTHCIVQNGAVVPIITDLPVESHGDYIYPSWLWPGSVVHDLYEISEELANAFDWPGREAAAWFVLTGEAPEVQPIDSRWEPKISRYLNPQWRIRLTVPPWVPAEEVLRAYQLLRGQILKGRELPKTTTPLEVARFVWEQERLYGYREPTPWSNYFQRWKDENPMTDIKNYRNFRTIFFRGDTAVKELNYNWPQPRIESLPEE